MCLCLCVVAYMHLCVIVCVCDRVRATVYCAMTRSAVSGLRGPACCWMHQGSVHQPCNNVHRVVVAMPTAASQAKHLMSSISPNMLFKLRAERLDQPPCLGAHLCQPGYRCTQSAVTVRCGEDGHFCTHNMKKERQRICMRSAPLA